MFEQDAGFEEDDHHSAATHHDSQDDSSFLHRRPRSQDPSQRSSQDPEEEENGEGDDAADHMTFVVDNLQQYFMADVLESQFSILIRSVEQSTNFEDLSIAHDNFLAAVLTHTFVNNKAVSIVGINQSYLIVNVILCERRCYE